MTTFDDREHAFEAKFAHDEEMVFKAEARTNKKLGLWAAELLGKSDDEAEEYAKTVIIADFEEAGHEDVIRKVAADLEGKADADTIRAKRADTSLAWINSIFLVMNLIVLLRVFLGLCKSGVLATVLQTKRHTNRLWLWVVLRLHAQFAGRFPHRKNAVLTF